MSIFYFTVFTGVESVPPCTSDLGGAAADLAVFALDEIDLGDEVRVDDLPTGSWRYSRKPAGYRATVVNGVPTWAGDQSTGALPGQFLRNGAVA